MVLMKNWQFFLLFILGKKGQHNVFQDILERKKTAFDTKKPTSQKKSKNWDFSKRDSPWSWSKKGNCSILFIFGKIGQENVFHDILQKKPLLKILKTVI